MSACSQYYKGQLGYEEHTDIAQHNPTACYAAILHTLFRATLSATVKNLFLHSSPSDAEAF